MAVEYNQHTWGYGEELTPDKFNNIEGGVKANADAINEVNNNLTFVDVKNVQFQFYNNKAYIIFTMPDNSNLRFHIEPNEKRLVIDKLVNGDTETIGIIPFT